MSQQPVTVYAAVYLTLIHVVKPTVSGVCAPQSQLWLPLVWSWSGANQVFGWGLSWHADACVHRHTKPWLQVLRRTPELSSILAALSDVSDPDKYGLRAAAMRPNALQTQLKV
jgi:hypothetical protein